MRRLFFDVARQRRYNAALASVDAQTCYDRVVHSVVSLMCQASGLPPGPIIVMLAAIQQMKFHLRTAYGDSSSTYSGTAGKPFMGLCQGNGGAPAGWAIASSFMIAMLYCRNHQCEIVSAVSRAAFIGVVFMFVDDADLPKMAQTPLETLASIAIRLQRQVDDWRGSLNVTGGALKPIKCAWVPIQWKWKQGVPSLEAAKDIPQDISVVDPKGRRVVIKKMDATDAMEVMGVWQAADGNMDSQVEALKDKADAWAASLGNGYLHQRSVWMAFRGSLWSSLRYSLPATNMTADEAQSILKQALPKILPRLGLNRNLPPAFKYAPRKYQGLGLPHCRLEELIEQLNLFMMHYGSGTQLGNMITVSEQDLIMEIGSGSHPLSLPFDTYGHLATPCWITSIWSKLHMAGVQLIFPQAELPKLQREGDKFLMDVWINSGQFSPSDLRALNRCRRKKQVYSLADLMSGRGDRLRNGCFARSAPLRSDASSYLFPNEHPSTKDWSVWAAGVRSLLNHRGHCQYHLGPWTSPQQHRTLPWRYDSETDRLYQQIGQSNHWLKYRSIQPYSFRRERSFQLEEAAPPPHSALDIAIVEKQPNGWCILEGSAPVAGPTSPPTAMTLADAMRSVMKGWGCDWLWDYVEWEDDIGWLPRALKNGTALLICDGSYKPKSSSDVGAAAWILRCTDCQHQVVGVLQSPGSIANAYRSELTGLYAVLAFTLACCDACNLREGNLTLGCDNIVGLRKAADSDRRVPSRTKHADVIRAIRQVRAKLPLEVSTIHVYGHQDDHTEFADLEEEAQMNTICDDYAKRHLDWIIDSGTAAEQYFPHELVVCSVDGSKCTGDVGPPIRNEFGRRQMRQHLLKRNDFASAAAFEGVDWTAVEAAMGRFPDLFAMWVTKHVSKFCGTNKQLYRMKSRADPYCPHPDCHRREIEEDSVHIMHCEDESRNQSRQQGYDDISKWLVTAHTEPHLREAITVYLHGEGSITFAEASLGHASLAHIAAMQDDIGWDNFVCGRIALLIRGHVEAHLRMAPTRLTATSWCCGFVTRLLELVHKQWTVRNDFVHGITEQGAKREELTQLRDSITAELLEGSDTLLPEFRALFNESFETLWAKSVSDRRQWLVEVAAARTISDIEPEPPPAAPDPSAVTPASRSRQRPLPPRLSGRRRKRS